MTNTAVEPTKKELARQNATRYLADEAYLSILGKPQPSKLRQVMKSVQVEGVTIRLIRHVMNEDSRFECVDRRWSPAVRYGDSRRPVESVITNILKTAGVPLTVEAMAQELAEVFSRTVQHFTEALPRMLADRQKYFSTADGRYGLVDWLLTVQSEEEEDVVFDSGLSQEQVDEFTTLCPSGKWSPDKLGDAAAATVKKCKQAVPMKVLALMAWRELGEDLDPMDFYAAVCGDERLLLLSDQKLYSSDSVGAFTKTLAEVAEELAALPMEPEEEEAEGPVTVTETDRDEMVEMILSRGSASAEELLDAVLEVGPEESGFAGALESLSESLRGDERVQWLGGTRWGKVIEFPDEVKEIPAALVVPAVPVFETPEGDVYDQMLEEDGFDGDLKAGVYDPLAEDVTDEDPARTMYQENGDSQRCVLKYQHRIEGTFPLCQIHPDFFGTDPEIIPIVISDEGKRKEAFVNNSTRLIYGLRDLYGSITEVSGAVFYIEKTGKPGEYRFRFDGETDEQLSVDTGRSLELVDLKGRYESSEMPIYDVMKEVLAKQGMTFAQLVNEVNIVKRCSRLLIASVLSSYHAFHTRGKGNAWQFDAKKESQGFNKAKRKYVKKD